MRNCRMEIIHIKGSTEYDVLVENGILADVGTLLRERIGGDKALVVTDDNVARFYLDEVSEALADEAYAVTSLVITPGEENKDIEHYSAILNSLAGEDFGKGDILIALGGGVIGDLVGFAAATFKRGMHCVQLPTSLLAAVDSSVGGKNAINLPNAKNQVGTIRNPDIVICDPNCMETLPERALHDGYAEIIKYGILNGYEIIDELRSGDLAKVIAMAVGIKRDFVEMDEEDTLFRQYLNLGHMIGHAIEARSGYEITHGEAVAKGLSVEARCCALSGFIEMTTYLEITEILEEFDFDLSCRYSPAELLPYIMNDKRIRNGIIQLLIPESIGSCNMQPIAVEKLKDIINLI